MVTLCNLPGILSLIARHLSGRIDVNMLVLISPIIRHGDTRTQNLESHSCAHQKDEALLNQPHFCILCRVAG